MRKLIVTSFFVFILFCSYSQEGNIEKEIREIEEKRVSALLAKDTAAYLKIYAPDFIANRPIGIVSTREKSIERIVADSLSFTSYKFEMEQISIKKNFVVTMGNEQCSHGAKIVMLEKH